jgi:hypothetical protein
MRGIAEKKLRLRCHAEWKVGQAKVVLIHNANLEDVELYVPKKKAMLKCAQVQCSTGLGRQKYTPGVKARNRLQNRNKG